MLPFTDCELDSIAAAVESALDKTCVIKRTTRTKDTWGTETETIAPVATKMAIVSKPSASLLADYASKLGSLVTWQIQLPNGTDVRLKDTLLIEGIEMTVQALLTPKSYSFLTNVLAAEVS
jgi:hypothetical protein